MARQLARPNAALLGEITSLQNDEYVEQLEQEIHAFVRKNQMTDDLYNIRAKFVHLVSDYLKSEAIVQQLQPHGLRIKALNAFGSYATHCATQDSDLDLCISATSHVGEASPLTVLKVINNDLQSNPDSRRHFEEHTISEIVFVETARVPIVRFKIDEVPVDLSVSFDASPPRGSLAALHINAYCQLDPRIAVLVIFLKTWLKSEMSTGDFLREYPNSYSLTMLLIHALQWYGVVPLLSEESFLLDYTSDWDMLHIHQHFVYPLEKKTVEEHKTKWSSGLSVVQLLKLFAHHYSNGMMLATCQLNMRNGQIEQRPRSNQRAHSIEIVDSFDGRNPARTVRSSGYFTGAMKDLLNLVERPQKNMFSGVWRIPQLQLSKNVIAQRPPSIPQYTARRRPQTIYQGNNQMMYFYA